VQVPEGTPVPPKKKKTSRDWTELPDGAVTLFYKINHSKVPRENFFLY
jgi:hypothetical protein